ncbi:hypothetical protein ACFQHO_32870 [Actinomadura yumaensis]|uniref:hypothetical protein n=1 Tax=Actinomadura yumaensis TaxID=111807 RepID=UPI00361FAFC2
MRPGFVLGIDFGGTKIALATATPDGRTLRRARLETRGREGRPRSCAAPSEPPAA